MYEGGKYYVTSFTANAKGVPNDSIYLFTFSYNQLKVTLLDIDFGLLMEVLIEGQEVKVN